jgi:hypothetical protein
MALSVKIFLFAGIKSFQALDRMRVQGLGKSFQGFGIKGKTFFFSPCFSYLRKGRSGCSFFSGRFGGRLRRIFWGKEGNLRRMGKVSVAELQKGAACEDSGGRFEDTGPKAENLIPRSLEGFDLARLKPAFRPEYGADARGPGVWAGPWAGPGAFPEKNPHLMLLPIFQKGGEGIVEKDIRHMACTALLEGFGGKALPALQTGFDLIFSQDRHAAFGGKNPEGAHPELGEGADQVVNFFFF